MIEFYVSLSLLMSEGQSPSLILQAVIPYCLTQSLLVTPSGNVELNQSEVIK